MSATVDQWITRQGENAEYVSKLGHGGYGEVHKLRNTITSQEFARKLLRPFADLTQEEIENEVRAMDTLCRGKHENLIEIYNHGEHQYPHQFYFIDMELCDTNLDKYIKGEKRNVPGLLEWNTAIENGHAPFLICAIMQQLLSGLKFIHDHNQVHRDLNPQNVLYSSSDRCWKIADFGLASGATVKLKTTEGGRGKAGYRAPELLKSPKASYNKKTDIWSLGCILVEISTRAKAFHNDICAHDWIRSHQPLEIKLPDRIDSRYKPILTSWANNMLERDHEKRPTIDQLCSRFSEFFYNLALPTTVGELEQVNLNFFFQPENMLSTDVATTQDVLPRNELLPSDNFDQHLRSLNRYKRTMDARGRLLGLKHDKSIWSMICYAWTCFYISRTRAERQQRVSGSDDMKMLQKQSSDLELALKHFNSGRIDLVEPLVHQVIETQKLGLYFGALLASSSKPSRSIPRRSMSDATEVRIRGIMVEILETCFVYGHVRVQGYRYTERFRPDDADNMEKVVNKLLNIRDFYFEFWPFIPNEDRRVLGKCLERIHRIIYDNSIKESASSVVVGGKPIVASSPTKVYQQIGYYSAVVNAPAVTSEDESKFVTTLWERVKKEVDTQSDSSMDIVYGRDQQKRLINIAGEWINKVDELIAFRSNQLILENVITPEKLEQRVQRFNLPNTSNQIDLLRTSLGMPPIEERESPLSPIVTAFDSETITITDDSPTLQPTLTRAHGSSLTVSLGQNGNRHWAKFCPEINVMTDSLIAQKVILEYKPISQFDIPVNDRGVREEALNQVRSLIKALHIGARDPSKFHVLDCLGLVEYPEKIGIIFKVPFENHDQFRCQTLNSLLLNEPDLLTQKLSNRISLATSLAWSLSRFHMARWVHKSFTSDNILLFQDRTRLSEGKHGYSWNRPYLVGFDLARLNIGASGPMFRPLEWRQRAYTHPDRLRNNNTASPEAFVRFTKRHDIYSLGVVLLELGRARPFTTEQPPPSVNYSKLSPADLWKTYRVEASELSQTIGDIYAEVTLRCLDGDFGFDPSGDDVENTLLMKQFIVRVCERLQSIQV